MEDDEIKALEKEISILRKVRLIRCSISAIQQLSKTVCCNLSPSLSFFAAEAQEYLYDAGSISRQGYVIYNYGRNDGWGTVSPNTKKGILLRKRGGQGVISNATRQYHCAHPFSAPISVHAGYPRDLQRLGILSQTRHRAPRP